MGESTQKRVLMRQEEEFPGASVVPVTKASQESWWVLDPSGLGTRSLRWGKYGGGQGAGCHDLWMSSLEAFQRSLSYIKSESLSQRQQLLLQ